MSQRAAPASSHSYSQSLSFAPSTKPSSSTASTHAHASVSQPSISSRPKARPVSTATGSSQYGSTGNIANPPPSRTSISSSAIVAEKAVLVGPHEIRIDAHAVIHPFARLDASRGAIIISEGVVVWERAHIGAAPLPSPEDDDGTGEEKDEDEDEEETLVETVLGRGTIVETSAVIEVGAKLGDECTVEVGARVGTRSLLSEFVKLAPCTLLPRKSIVDPFTSFYWTQGQGIGESGMAQQVQRSRVNETMKIHPDVQELQRKGQRRHVDLLKRLVKSNLAKWTTAAART